MNRPLLIVVTGALGLAAGLGIALSMKGTTPDTPSAEPRDDSAETFSIPSGPTLTEGDPQAQAPIYFFLFTHTEDHINHELSEERYTRGSEMIETLAEQESSLVWTIEFMGADAQSIAERNDQTGIVDLLKELADEGLAEFGYHAHHDPTYLNRPQNDLPTNPTYQQVYDALTTWITCIKDPLYGGCVEEEGGGLQAIQATFGPVQVVSGLGVTEGAQVERSAGVMAVEAQAPDRWLGFGFPDHGATAKIEGYLEAREAFFQVLTPTHETSSALFWMDNVLRVNDGIPADGLNSLKVSDGASAAADLLSDVDRSRPNSLNVGFMDKYLYTVDKTSPTKWAYSNPESPELPDDLTHPRATIEKNYARSEEGLAYLVETFIPENPGSRFVSSEDLFGLATSEDYLTVEEDELTQLALWLLNEWTDVPPVYAYDGEDFYSLTDAFYLLVHALQNESSEGVVSHYFAAWSMDETTAGATSFSYEAVVEAVQDIDLDDRLMPETFTVDGTELSPGQFLYAISYLWVARSESAEVNELPIPATGSLPETYALLEALGCTGCSDTTWSLKPARFQD